jgi:hypothetical protein
MNVIAVAEVYADGVNAVSSGSFRFVMACVELPNFFLTVKAFSGLVNGASDASRNRSGDPWQSETPSVGGASRAAVAK